MVWVLSKHGDSDYENARLLQEFAARGVHAQLVQPNKFSLIVDWKSSNNVTYKGSDDKPDCLLVRTGSGTDYQALSMIRDYEQHGVLCINSSTSTVIAKDKFLSGQIMACHGLSTPTTMMIKHPVDVATVRREFGFPCVLKVNTGSYGRGVHLIRTEDDFQSLIQLIEAVAPNCQMLIQKFIATKIGSDLRVWVIGGKVIGAMQRKGVDGDFRANITNGGTGEDYPLNEKIEELASKAAATIGLDIAGVDLLFDGEGYTVCEVNSSPGFSGFEKYCGKNIAGEIADYVISKLNR